MASHLKEIKLQLGDDLLHCALVNLTLQVDKIKVLYLIVINFKAKSDNITQLEKFRCHSEPTFVFIAVKILMLTSVFFLNKKILEIIVD